MAAIRSLIELAKETGARRIRADGIEVEMWAPAIPAPAVQPGAPAADEPGDDLSGECPCGCELIAHGPGGCYQGCPPSKCHPPPKPAPAP